MDRLTLWATSRPITASSIALLLVLMCGLLLVRRKNAAHLIMARPDCPPTLRLERDLFNAAKWLVIALALISLVTKF